MIEPHNLYNTRNRSKYISIDNERHNNHSYSKYHKLNYLLWCGNNLMNSQISSVNLLHDYNSQKSKEN